MNSSNSDRRALVWLGIATSIMAFIMAIVVGIAFWTSGNDDAEIEKEISRAQKLFDEQRFVEARDVLIDVLPQRKEDPTTLKLFAKTCLRVPVEGNAHVSSALAMLQRYVEMKPDDLEILKYLVNLYERSGSHDLVVKFAKRAIAISPDDKSLHASIVRAHIADNSLEQAIKSADEMLDRFPQNLQAFELRLRAMVADGALVEEIQQFADDRKETQQDKALEMLQRHIVARIVGNNDDAQTTLEQLCATPHSDSSHVAYVAGQLELAGQFEKAIDLLSNTTNEKDFDAVPARRKSPMEMDATLHQMLTFRLWQRGELTALATYFQKHKPVHEELKILDCLTLLSLNQVDDARDKIAAMDDNKSQLIRIWKNVLQRTIEDPTPGAELLAACQDGLAIYPNLAYLVNHRAVAYEVLGEENAAIADYRRAVQLAPRWVAPRGALARIYAGRGEFRESFDWATSSLAINPNQSPVIELALRAGVETSVSGKTLSPGQQRVLEFTLEQLIDSTQNESSKLLLQASQDLVRGDRHAADEKVRQLVESSDELNAGELRIARTISQSPALRDEIAKGLKKHEGKTRVELVREAVKLAKAKNVEAGLNFLNKYKVGDQKPADIFVRIAKAELLDQFEDKRAKDAWLDITKDFAIDRNVINMAIQSPALSDDRDARDNLIKQLKKQSGESGMAWRVERARWLLDFADKTTDQKQAAEAVLLLNKVVEVVPNHAEAFFLLALCFDTLSADDKAIETLRRAIESGNDEPWIVVELATRLNRSGFHEEAAHFAQQAGKAQSTTFEVRQRAVSVLLDAKEFSAAAGILERDLPATPIDDDETFALVSVYGVSVANLGKTEKAEALIWPLVKKSDRWLDLWIDLSSFEDTTKNTAQDWLTRAETIVKADDQDRRRKLAVAWGRLSRRFNDPGFAANGCEVLANVAESKQDQLLLASLFQQADEYEAAADIYRQMIQQDPNSPLAMNNLAMIYSRTPEKWAEATKLAKSAMRLDKRPQIVDTVVEILVAQDRHAEAIDLLKVKVQQHADYPALAIRLCKLLVDRKEFANAESILKRIQGGGGTDTLTPDQWQQVNELFETIHANLQSS